MADSSLTNSNSASESILTQTRGIGVAELLKHPNWEASECTTPYYFY